MPLEFRRWDHGAGPIECAVDHLKGFEPGSAFGGASVGLICCARRLDAGRTAGVRHHCQLVVHGTEVETQSQFLSRYCPLEPMQRTGLGLSFDVKGRAQEEVEEPEEAEKRLPQNGQAYEELGEPGEAENCSTQKGRAQDALEEAGDHVPQKGQSQEEVNDVDEAEDRVPQNFYS